MQLGEKLYIRLKSMKLTQTQLAERSGITQAAVNKYIKNKSRPSYDNILKLAQVLEVSPGWFFPERETSASATQHVNFHGADIIASLRQGKMARHTTFVIGHYLPMQHLPPPSQAPYAGIATNFYNLIFNVLVQRSLLDHAPHAFLAIDWKPIRNSWLFRLRGGVQFHDGRPLTVEDVAWSYEQYSKNNPQEHNIQRVEIIDESVVAIYLQARCPLGSVPMPRIMPAGMRESPDRWVGTGPFQATELNPGFWRLKANPFYFLGRPFFDEIHIREYDDPQALEHAMVSKEVHFAIGIDVPNENFIVKAEAAVQRYHLHFLNFQNDLLVANYSFRKAIALGLDRKALAQAAGLKTPLFSPGPFDYLLQDRSAEPPFPPDLQEARKLLKHVKNLKDSVFRVRCYTRDPQARALEKVLVDQLTALGIPTQVGDPPSAVLVRRNTRVFETESRLWTTDAPQSYNFNSYSNKEVDDLIQQCLSSEVTLSRVTRLRELIQRDLPDIPLFYGETPLTYVKQLVALEKRMILLSCLNDIHNWYLD